MSLVQRGISPTEATADGTLLDAQGANTDGVWYRLDRIVPWSITIRGPFTATVTIYVSNQVTKPLDADNDQAVFQGTTTPTQMGSTLPFRWIKARVTGWGNGAVTVDLMAGA